MNIKHYFTPSGLIFGAVCMLIGGIIGYNLHADTRVIKEQAAPAIELPSGGHVAERTLDAPVPASIKEAVKEMKKTPAKGKLTRAGSVTVKPTQADCPPVTIDWGLVKQNDKKGSRMVFTTEDGTILKATDIPVETVEIERFPKWSVGAIAPIDNPSGVGPVVERHFGKLSVGVAVVKDRAGDWQGMATVKVSW